MASSIPECITGECYEKLTKEDNKLACLKEEHKQLASVIKNVHANLRKKYKSDGQDYEAVWEDHCSNQHVLEEYAMAMHHLATNHWTKNGKETRIDWCRKMCIKFFLEGGLAETIQNRKRRTQRQKQRQEEICQQKQCIRDPPINLPKKHHSFLIEESGEAVDIAFEKINREVQEKIVLLDAGSCYNPFQDFAEFLPLGIDICPAVPTVHQCDLTRVDLSDDVIHGISNKRHYLSSMPHKLKVLPKDFFHVVVFSLLLGYIPSPQQRLVCCQQAFDSLMVHGLLVIITPDSNKPNKNAPMMKSWRLGLEQLGFHRVYYEKLEHLHCMAFRKTANTPVSCDRAEIAEYLYIPQDRHDVVDEKGSKGDSVNNPSNAAENLSLLEELTLFGDD